VSGPGSGPDDEAALVRAIAAGSTDALAALYDRHVDSIFATVMRGTDDRQLAEEVVQDTFLALWDRAELFDPAMGSLGTWLRTIARNRTIDRLRAAGRRPRLVSVAGGGTGELDADALDRAASAGALVGGTDRGSDPEGQLERVELREEIAAALRAMPDDERTVILLAYQDELTQAEIAERQGWPLGTVKTRTRRALRRLRAALGEQVAPDDEPATGDGG
jgi:RNA polymerase sigma-70 factor (ECF subfamily)